MRSFLKYVAGAACGAALVASQSAHAVLRINEMMINAPGGSDVGRQFFEIIGNPGESVSNTFIVVLNNEGTSLGTVTAVLDLTSAGAVGSNGLLLVRDAATTMLPTPAAGTAVLSFAGAPYIDLDNDHHTYVLVKGFTGVVTDDLDTNDNGTLETMPWTQLLDAVSIENDSGEPDIATSLGGAHIVGAGVFTPDLAFRDPNNPSHWVGCDALGAGLGPYTIDATNVTDAAYASVAPSPGNVNGGLLSNKALTFNEIMMNAPGTDNGLEFVELKGNNGESVSGVSLVVVDNDAPGIGTILNVVDLSPAVWIGQNGLLLIRDSATVLSPAPDVATTSLVSDFVPDLPDTGATYILVTGFSGSVGNDLDTNDNGTLETTPWTAVIDALYVADPDGEPSIANPLGGQSTVAQLFAPDAFVLAPIGGALVVGDVTGSGAGPFLLSASNVDPAGYASQNITPGSANPVVLVGVPAMKVEFFEESK